MSFTVPVFAPNALARTIASNAAMALSAADSLLFAAKRIGTNRDGAPVSGMRSISAILASQPSARCTVLPTANRQDSIVRRLIAGNTIAGNTLVTMLVVFCN
jgi:hypothetical protein